MLSPCHPILHPFGMQDLELQSVDRISSIAWIFLCLLCSSSCVCVMQAAPKQLCWRFCTVVLCIQCTLKFMCVTVLCSNALHLGSIVFAAHYSGVNPSKFTLFSVLFISQVDQVLYICTCECTLLTPTSWSFDFTHLLMLEKVDVNLCKL